MLVCELVDFDRPFFERMRDWIVEGGFPVEEADIWLDSLSQQTQKDEFLFTRNFYAITGIK